MPAGVSFAERFAGHANTPSGDFDTLQNSALPGLSLVVGAGATEQAAPPGGGSASSARPSGRATSRTTRSCIV